MRSKRFHRYIGLIMLAPMICWALTGLVFFIKPGYDGAYEVLQVRTYPLNTRISISPGADWEEVQLIRSILGTHLLVKSGGKFSNLDPLTLEKMPVPNKKQLKQLFEDAFSQNPDRYGLVKTIEGTSAITTTNITVSLNWSDLTLSQRGRDREIVELLYRIHYLQWTPWPTVNQALGTIGLFLLATLSILGYTIAFRK